MSNIRIRTQGNIVEVAESLVSKRTGRVRKPTLLKLQWLAERARKCEVIRQQVANGTYRVDSEAVAKAILNEI